MIRDKVINLIVSLFVVGVMIVYSVYVNRILKHNLSITDEKLWIGGGDGGLREAERVVVTGDQFAGKMCRLEAVEGMVRDQYGGTVKEDREVPCGTCSNFSYKVGDQCVPYKAKFDYTNFGDDMNFTGYCGVDDTDDEPGECMFRTPLQM